MHHIVGSCDAVLFGLPSAERLRRQAAKISERVLVADAGAVLGEAAIAWLIENPDSLLISRSGRPLAVVVAAEQQAQGAAAIAGAAHSYRVVDSQSVGPQFVRKLRRSSLLLAHSLAEEDTPKIERALFADAYKGVTDLVTKWLWPVPAFWATKGAARIGFTPNMVTCISIVLTLGAAWQFAEGQLVTALAAAWLMTFLDTVDGKLARVTVTSSRLGNLLDHVTDYVHPPVWWICLAAGLAGIDPSHSDPIWTSCWIILATYAAGRVIEESFKRMTGFNQYMWRRFDSWFRLIVARRNVILLIMTLGLVLSNASGAYLAAAGWSVLSVSIQAIRFGQAIRAHRRNKLKPWLA